MKKSLKQFTEYFETANGDKHQIDTRGNHFVNGKCVNPKRSDFNPVTGKRLKIGSTYPPMEDRIYPTR